MSWSSYTGCFKLGSQNTAIGREGLSGLTTGTQNTVLGYLAGHDETTGSYNVLIGVRRRRNDHW